MILGGLLEGIWNLILVLICNIGLLVSEVFFNLTGYEGCVCKGETELWHQDSFISFVD